MTYRNICVDCNQTFEAKESTRQRCKSCSYKYRAAKTKETCMIRYGVSNPSKLPSVVRKIKQTMMSKYGAESAIQVPKFRDKIQKTTLAKYGVPYYVMSQDCGNGNLQRESQTNKKFSELLTANNIPHITEYRIETKLYDFCIEDQRILIEIDPTYTHNSLGNHLGEGLDSTYHLEKSKLASDHGYRCIHVFDWDNVDKIIDIVNPNKQRTYARACNIEEIDSATCDEFLERNHLQGTCRGQKLRFGLYWNNTLVQVMTFGKPRYNKNYEWELLRLCTLRTYNVVGGANKLFKYITQHNNLSNIISYCDTSKFNGRVYSELGMKFEYMTRPRESWSKGTSKISAALLKQRGYDQLFGTDYGKGTDNVQLMIDHDWLPVYDCGQLVFSYKHDDTQDASIQDTDDIDFKKYQLPEKKPIEKLCEFCGEPFVPSSNYQRYCKREHYMNCPVCGKRYLVTNNENLKRPPVACSYACRVARTQKTSLEKYGMLAPGNNPEARKKAKETTQKRFGVDYAMQNKEVLQKQQSVLIEKYGVDNIGKVPEIARRRVQTFVNNHPGTEMRHKDAEVIKYDRPKVLYFHHDSDFTMYQLKLDVVSSWVEKYYPKKLNRIVAGFGLVKDSEIYQIIVLTTSSVKYEYLQIGLMFELPEHHIIEGYTKLFNFMIQDIDHIEIYANVDMLYENIEDFVQLGFEQIKVEPARYYYTDDVEYHTWDWIKRHSDLAANFRCVKDKGYVKMLYSK